MTTALESFQEALAGGADDDALDVAAADVRRDAGPAAYVEAIKMRIARDLGAGKTELDVTALRFRLAQALEDTAKMAEAKEAAAAALEAAALFRDVLNDGEATSRNLLLALKHAANDDALLKRAVEAAGGRENAESIVEKALKKPEVKEDPSATAALRRALSRVAENAGDKERAFFEALKAARKMSSDGMYVDEVFRLAIDTKRDTEAAAFFGALADDAGLPERQRATLYNKLGQTLERLAASSNEANAHKRNALEAYTKSLRFHEAKAAKRAVERLAGELGVVVDLPTSGAVAAPPANVASTAPAASAANVRAGTNSAIRIDEPPDHTPPYDHKTGQVTTEQEASASGSLKARHKPAEITMPRAVSPTSETAEVVRPDDKAAANKELPRASDVNDPTASAPHAPRPISVPPAPVDAHVDAHGDDAKAAHERSGDVVDERFSIANLPSFDDEPAPTVSQSTSGVVAHDAKPSNPFATPALQAVLAKPHVAEKPIAVEAPLASSASAPVLALDEHPSSPFSLPGADLSSDAVVEIPIVKPTPPAPPSAPTAATVTQARAELAQTLASVVEQRAPKPPSIDDAILPLESALARLPARNAEPVEEPTKRGPHANVTAQNSEEATSEQTPAKRTSGEKKKSRKEKKRERTQKKKLTAIVDDTNARVELPVAKTDAKLPQHPKGLLVSSVAEGDAVMPSPNAPPPSTQTLNALVSHEPGGESAAAHQEPDDAPTTQKDGRRRRNERQDERGDDVSTNASTVSAQRARGGIEGIELPPAVGTSQEGPATDPQARGSRTDAAEDDVVKRARNGHTLQPPSDEVTGRAPSRDQPATLEAMPPLHVPPLTVPEMEGSNALQRALAALEDRVTDADECARVAADLAKEAANDPRVLRLAAKAMLLTASTGQMPKEAVELFVQNAPKHGERAAGFAVDVLAKVPAATRRAYTHVWIAAAKAAGLDVARVLALLRDVAVEDAPEGPAFELAERVLVDVNDSGARDSLYQAALKAASDDKKRAELTKRRIGLLEVQSKFAEALPLHAQLAADLASADVGVRSSARRAFAQHGTPDERARFLARLARKLPGDEGIDVVQELLDVRLSVDDRLGAEAAAKDLLQRRPGDGRATRVIADLLEDEPHRVDELIDVLRVGSQQALSWFGKTGEARTLLERLAAVQQKAGKTEDAADAWVQVARLVPDEKNLDRALQALDDVKRHKEALALLEETASSVADTAFRAKVLLRAAEIAKSKLQKRGKARELVERALELQPRDRGGLRIYAELLVEIGDAASAIDALERLAAEEPMSSPTGAKERAAIQLRIGHLVEEHLLKPDDALKRYRAAAEMDASNKDAWNAIRAISRQRGDRALLVESLKGLAGAESDAHEKAALWRQIAKVERDERADTQAAERAFGEALAIDAGDVESLMSLAALAAARLQPDVDLEASLAQPNDALLDALRAHIVKVPAANVSTLPLSLRRLSAIALSRSGERAAALARFEEILAEQPEELATLMALARHLAAAPRTESGAEGRRLRCLETILLHHAYALKPPVQVDVWGEVTALRAATGDGAGARKAAKKVMALSSTDELRACLSDRAVRAVALALDDARDAERDPKSVIAALKMDSDRSVVEAEKSRLLERAAAIAHDEMKDRVFARALLEDAVRANPSSQSAREALLDLDVAAGDVAGALKQVRDLLAKESDPKRKALLHLRLFRLRKKVGLDLEGAAAELKSAVELDASNAEVLDAAEQFFTERNDTDGLDKLWSAQLRTMDRTDLRARLKLLERIAQLRRYERRDLAGAVEALEAMTAIDPEALKPREDAARLYTELGMAKEAVGAWRGVLERDPLIVEAWRGIFGRYAATRQGDEAFAVASTMAALELADDDIARAVKTIRPPFPRWPIPPKDALLFRRKVAHPLERTPVRAILDITAPRLLPLYARRMKEFGFHKRDALLDKNVPTSVLLAVRTLAQLLGLKEPPPLFLAELGASDAQAPPFAVLPSTEPGVIVTNDVIKGGMTPERAFALGRAASWLQPHAVMSAAVDTQTLRAILEGLTSAFLGPKNLERPDLETEKLGKDLAHALTAGMSSSDEGTLKSELLPALRDYVHARQQVQVSDWRAGVGYTGDRVGFLMATDLNAAFRVIKATAGTQSIGARLAIKELVLFSVSPGYFALRKDLGLALPELAASPLVDLG